MTSELILIYEKGNMRRFRRGLSRFDPNAVDADGDGMIQDSTPFQRPATPPKRQMRGPMGDGGARLQSRFWDYTKPQRIEVPDELLDDEPQPKPQNWRDVPLKPRSGEMVSDTTKHTIKTNKVSRDQWLAFQDAILERMMEVRDDTSVAKDERRGIMKLYASLRAASPKKDEDGSLSVSLTDTERARILKGIQSMKKKKMDIPNLEIIQEMLEAVEGKSAFFASASQVSRNALGNRFKSEHLFRVVISDNVSDNSRMNLLSRNDGFRTKGSAPRQRIDIKALGTSIGGTGRRSGRLITTSFDPNAVDADADGLVQDGTAFERPATPQTPSILGNQKPVRGGLQEAKKKPGKKNAVLKAQADRKAMNFQIEKLRSTLRRVGNDYAPQWWDTKSDSEFKKNLAAASPEELSELFARIYVERRSLMTSKIGRMPNGTIAVYADTPNDVSKNRNAKLQKRGEQVYREMVGRLLDVENMSPAQRKKRAAQFEKWYLSAADNADWYFEQSFKISKRKSRKKLGIDAPVNKRGTRWAEDPDFPADSFDKVIDSIETDLLRANPRMSRTSSRRRAEQIVAEADKRMKRTPSKSPSPGRENRQIVNPAMAPRRLVRRLNPDPQQRLFYKSDYVRDYSKGTPTIARRDSAKAFQNMKAAMKQNEQRFGKLDTPSDFRNAFSSLGVNPSDIDMLHPSKGSTSLNSYDKSVLHSFLYGFSNNSGILKYKVTIKALSSEDVERGTGGSHAFVFNPKATTTRDTFTHIFSYSSFNDTVAREKQEWFMNGIQTRNGQPIPAMGLMDGAQNQISMDFLDKNYDPNKSKAELEKVYDDYMSLSAFITNMHEVGHGAHMAAIATDKYGQNFNGKNITDFVDNFWANASAQDKPRIVRNTLHSVLDIAFTNANNEAVRDFWFLKNEGVQIESLLNSIASGRLSITDRNILNSMPTQAAAQRWVQIVQRESQHPGDLKARMRVMNLVNQWQKTPVKQRSTMQYMEQMIADFQNDSFGIKKFGLTANLESFPLTANGQIDINKLMNPKKPLFQYRDEKGTIRNFNFYETFRHYTAKFLSHKDFEYDSLSDADKKIAGDALSKLSYYARKTRRYGPEYGETHVEGLAELMAMMSLDVVGDTAVIRSGDSTAPFTYGKFSADELRVMQTLFQWMGR